MYNLAESGAADKIMFNYGATEGVVSRMGLPNRYVGTSSGAIIGFALAFGKFKEVKSIGLNLSVEKDIYGYNPYSFKGVVKAIKSLFKKQSHIYSYDKLRDTLKKIVTLEEYNKGTRFEFYIGAYNASKLEETYWLVDKSLSYDEVLDRVIASCSIPFFSKGVVIDGDTYYDGGITSHIGSHFLARTSKKINKLVSIYSRPDKLMPEFLSGLDISKSKRDLLIWLNTVLNHNNSKNDESECDRICLNRGISQVKIFAPELLTSGLFNSSKEDHTTYYNMGLSQSKNK